MSIVNTTVPITSDICDKTILALVNTYPFCRTELLSTTAFQRPIRTLVIGNGPRRVLFTAAHHANEWITAYILLRWAEEFAEGIRSDGKIGDVDANILNEAVTVFMVPMVDP